MRKKIAVILSRFPYPLDKGDKLRAYHQLKYLSQYHDLYLFCLHTENISEKNLEKIQPLCVEIKLYKVTNTDILKGILFSLLNSYPIQVGYFFSARIKREIEEDISVRNIATVYCQLSRTALYAKDLLCRKVIDFQDAFSTNYKRLIESTTGIYRLFYQREYSTMLAFEQQILSWFDKCTIISGFDKSQINDKEKKIHVVPNGVDTNYFTPVEKEKKFDILFIGNLSYLPNKNAVFYLIKNIFPLLQKMNPSVSINIAGADTPKEIFELTNENITVSGFVPDIRDVYNTAKVFVAPLFAGAGLQNKILEAMSMQIPCITTSVVNSSLNAESRKEIFIANSEEEFATQILNLLNDENLQTEISRNAGLFIREQFSWQKANEKLKELL